MSGVDATTAGAVFYITMQKAPCIASCNDEQNNRNISLLELCCECAMEALEPFSHDPDELVRIAGLSALRGCRHGDFRTRLKDEFVSLCDNRYLTPVPNLVQKGFVILDSYFFLHALQDYGVRLSVKHHIKPSSVLEHGAFGTYHPHDRCICVCTHYTCGKRLRSIKQMLCALVHEMVHAYMHLFSAPEQYRVKVDTAVSQGQHGMPWNAVYHTVINSICQWSPSLHNFREVVDGIGHSQFALTGERLEYPKDDEEASGNPDALKDSLPPAYTKNITIAVLSVLGAVATGYLS